MIVATAALMFAASFSAVEAPDRYIEVLSRRFPAWAAMNRRSAYVLLDILVRPDGSIMRCKVEEASGSEKLAEQACSMVYNIRLVPARGADGEAVYGRTKFDIRFMSRGGHESRSIQEVQHPSDLTIDLPDVSISGEDKPVFQVAVLVEPDGVVADCRLGNRLIQSTEAVTSPPAQMVQQACQQVTGTRRGRILAQDGTASTYVDVLDVSVA